MVRNYWPTCSGLRSYAVEKALTFRKSFTDSIEYKKGFPSKGIAFISLDNQTISYLCLFEKRRKITTGKSLIGFSNAIEIDHPLLIDQIFSAIPSHIQRYFPERAKKEISLLAPSVLASILNHIEENHPSIYKSIRKLESKCAPALGRMYKSEILDFEKDSINLLLKIGRFSGYEIPEWSPIPEDAPFLSGFESFELREDAMINYDSQVFGDWDLIKRAIKGAFIFSKDNCQITIFNANRTPIEETLGVDLLIYHHTYSAYVLIQYKRMIKEGASNSYRPIDSSYIKEFQAMTDFLQKIISKSPKDLIDYRLNDEFYYFKICPSTLDDPSSQKMIPGMYIPLSYWNLLLSSDKTLGTRGGRVIQFENVERHISNSLFTKLFQDGWIGSKVNNSELISEQIRHSLQGNKSITFATIRDMRKFRGY